jgi:TRAP-type transport system periplasmic protein
MTARALYRHLMFYALKLPLFAFTCTLFIGSASAEQVVLKVHHFLGAQSIQQTKMLGEWCKRIAIDSNNQMICQIYPAMQLGGTPPQLFDQAKDGMVDIAWTAAGYSAGRFVRTQVFELPFTMTNAAASSRAAWDFVQKHAQDEYKDVKLLALHVHGPGVIFTRNKKITKLEDIKGLKLRAPTATAGKMLALMGATPVGMPVPAVPEALSKGVIDGTVLPYEVAYGLKVNELTNFTTETAADFPALYTMVFIMPMNKAKYESLPPNLKAVIDKNSGRELCAFLGATQITDDVPGRAIFKNTKSQTITTIPVAELQRWKKTTNPLNDMWVSDMNNRGFKGQDMLNDARALIQQYSK